MRLHPFVLVVHRFMDADELVTDRGQERLEACAFRVPVDRGGGELEMVSMCELNGSGLRAQLNRANRAQREPPQRAEAIRWGG